MNPDQPQPPTLIRRFRKKPVVIEAIQFTSEHLDECVAFCGGEYEYRTASQCAPFGEVLHIKTLEGTMTAVLGDWIIKGVKGEFYPCKPDIFEATYEPADLAPMSNVSETPRTDGKVLTWNLSERELLERQPLQLGYNGTSINGKVVLADFARQLERELTAVTKERDLLKEQIKALNPGSTSTGYIFNKMREAFLVLGGKECELDFRPYKLVGLAKAALARAEKAEEALRPLVAIADAWDANKLDDEARKHYGVNLEFTNMKNPDEIELYTGRGGKRLLTLADCLAARAALTPTKEPAS